MAHTVKCYYCGKPFDRDKEPAIKISNTRRYAHEQCYNTVHNAELMEANDLRKLESYIKELFNYKTIPLAVKLRIDKYVSENGYTYKGILQALTYFYEIKHGNKEKANGNIGIVPYVYDKAKNYYISLLIAQQQNEDKVIEEFLLPIREVHIPPPARPRRGLRRMFQFLNDEKEIEEVVTHYERKS